MIPRHHRPRTARLALLVAALLALAGVALPAAASAAPGTYSVWSCRDADGNPVSTAAWVPFGNVANPLTHSDTCATAGGWLGLQMIDPADYAGGSFVGYAVSAPPGTTIAAYQVQMAGQTSSPTGGTHFELGLMVDGPLVHTGDGCNLDIDPCRFGDLTAAWDSAANQFSASGLAAGAIDFGATCTAPSSCVVGSNATPYPAFGRLYRSTVQLTDANAPVVGAVAGSVGATGSISGRRAVVADASDLGGGVFRTQLLVDGAVVDQADGRGRCALPFTAAAPCPDATRAQFELDTTTLSDGLHTVAVRAFDAALNATDSAPLEVVVDNAPPPPVTVAGPTRVVSVPAAPLPVTAETASSSVPEPVVKPAVALTLKVPGRQTLPARTAAAGTVTVPAGTSKAGIPVRFSRRPWGGDDDDWTAAGAGITDGAGRFALPTVRRAGQLRVEVGTGFAATPAIIGYVAPIDLTLDASALRLENGEGLTLRGRVVGDGGAQSGRDVLVQALVRGSWRTVDSAEIGDDGRITWRYRFTNTSSSARYRFRFVLPKARALPWARTVTDPVTVLVRGSGDR